MLTNAWNHHLGRNGLYLRYISNNKKNMSKKFSWGKSLIWAVEHPRVSDGRTDEEITSGPSYTMADMEAHLKVRLNKKIHNNSQIRSKRTKSEQTCSVPGHVTTSNLTQPTIVVSTGFSFSSVASKLTALPCLYFRVRSSDKVKKKKKIEYLKLYIFLLVATIQACRSGSFISP